MSKPSYKESFLRELHPEAKEVGTWSYLWNNHRKTLFSLFLNIFRERPFFTVTLGLFFLNPSISLFLITFLSFIFCHLLNESVGQISVIINQLKIKKGAIIPLTQKYDDIVVSEHKISEYLSEYSYTDMSYFLVESYQKMLPFKHLRENPATLDDTLSIYVFDTNKAIIQNVASYPAPLRQSFIVFDHKPEECGLFQHFTILHEAGHIY